MVRTEWEPKRVWLRLDHRRGYAGLSPDDADQLADQLVAAAADADRAVGGRPHGLEPYEIFVQAVAETVFFKFGSVTDRLPMPPAVARQLAELIRREAGVARERLRIVLTHNKVRK